MAKDKKWILEGKPRYLELKGNNKKIKMIARFRCCNEWKGERYWESEEKSYVNYAVGRKRLRNI